MSTKPKPSFILVKIPEQLYTTMEENKSYFNWSKDVSEFIDERLTILEEQYEIKGYKSPKLTVDEKITTNVKIAIPREIYDRLGKYEKTIAWRREIIVYLQKKEEEIKEFKGKNQGLDTPEDVNIPEIQKEKKEQQQKKQEEYQKIW